MENPREDTPRSRRRLVLWLLVAWLFTVNAAFYWDVVSERAGEVFGDRSSVTRGD